jgi:hypothetical protein
MILLLTHVEKNEKLDRVPFELQSPSAPQSKRKGKKVKKIKEK